MATLLPVICTATVTNASKLVTVTGTDQSTGLPPVLSDLNCRPNGTVFIAGVGYLVGERLSTTTFNLERNYEGVNASGLSCTIGVFTPEMANRAELATQLREYSALVALLREDWNGLVYTLISPTGAADPGSGNLAFDNATPASITGMYLDVNDARGRTVTGQVMTWRTDTQVRVQSLETGAFVTVKLAATPTNQGPDEWISNAGLSLVESYLTLAPGEMVAVIYMIAGQGLATNAQVDTLAARAAHDAAAAGFTVRVNDVGDGRAAIYTKNSATSADWSAAAYVTGPTGAQGDKGWSPKHAVVADGARRVLQLTGYVGGAGTVPTANVGQYVGAAGYTATIGDAIDVRGPGGAAGLAGGGLKGIACRVVITTNVDLAGGGIAAGTTHDGVTLDANDPVLVQGQTAPAENGVYPAPAAGAASRHADFNTWDELVAAYFPVSEGTLYADTLWRNTNAKGGTLGTTALTFEEFSASGGLPRNYLDGLATANNVTDASNDIDFGAGACRDAANACDIIATSGLTKRLDVNFTAGTNQGMLDTGTKASGTSYHLFVIGKSADPTAFDFLASTSATAPTMPSGWDTKRRIWSIKTDGSGNILGYRQKGDVCRLKTLVTERNSTVALAAALFTLTAIPTGIPVRPILRVSHVQGTAGNTFVSLDDGDSAGSTMVIVAQNLVASALVTWVGDEFITNTSAQIYLEVTIISGTIGSCYLITVGWIDKRGRE